MEFQFDDVDGINAAASEEFGEWGREMEVTQEMIDAFAELTGDRQWIHIDVERAKNESPFGGPIAHGFLTLALVPRLNPMDLKIVGHGNATNYGAGGLRFLAPVPAGSKVHARTRLVGAEARKNGTLVTTELAIHVVGNDKPSLLYNMQILYMPKRSAS
jgi:acyl dehydratase